MGKSLSAPGAGHQWAWSWLEAGLQLTGARLSKLAAGLGYPVAWRRLEGRGPGRGQPQKSQLFSNGVTFT